MRNDEHLIQAAFFDVLKLHEKRYPVLKWIYAVPNGGKRNVITAAKLKREGVKAGVWDVHIPVPMYHYHGAWIEFKAGKNKLTESQKEFRQALTGKYLFAVRYSVDEALEFLNDYLEIEIKL
jgi:hypothetical protein